MRFLEPFHLPRRSRFGLASYGIPLSRFHSITKKFRHGGVSGLGDASTSDDLPKCAEQDRQIKAKAFVVDVPQIQPELFIPRKSITTIDLGPACDPRPNVMAAHLLR